MFATTWRNPLFRQWALLLAGSMAVVIVASLRGTLWRADLAFYDAATPTGAAPADITIVAIDDRSIAELGRWPWRRSVHAALLQRLSHAGARAVGLDIAFTESDTQAPQDDQALAAAMSSGPPVVLPLLVEMPTATTPVRERPPIALLADAAAAVGHVHLELDRDGVARSVFLREGLGTPQRPHFALALFDSAPGATPTALQGERHPDLAGASRDQWVRDYLLRIPFLGPPGHIHTVSYADVLRGAISDAALAGQWVLIGATAQGLGDAYPTPRSGAAVAMSGVEITANVLQGLRTGALIRTVPWLPALLLSLLPIAVAFAAFLRLSPDSTLRTLLLLWLGTLAVSVLLLRSAGWWWSPVTALATLTALYPIWSWRRLAAAQGFLEDEFARFNDERAILFTAAGAPAATAKRPAGATDSIERRIRLVRDATQRLRDVRQLLGRAIRDLPDAVILADHAARIVIANRAAAQLAGAAEPEALEGTAVDAFLFARSHVEALRSDRLAAAAPCMQEARLGESGPDVLVRAVQFDGGSGPPGGTLISITDVSALRAAQRAREDVARFLSHDMKSPANSLLALAQLQRDPARALTGDLLSERLDTLAHRLLGLVDGFIALARVEAANPAHFEPFDLRDAIQDAIDEVWATAHAQRIALRVTLPDDALVISGERHSLARAVTNLLVNAVKFSPPGGSVRLDCARAGDDAVISVADGGPGVAAEKRAELFQRFSRQLHRGAANPSGSGLGLAFVRAVTEQLGGRAWHDADAAAGARFCLAIPLGHGAGDSA